MTEDAWQLFDVDQLRSELAVQAAKYREFLRVPALHCGLYRLEKGSRDMQTPHDEDEVYYVLEGRAKLKIGDDLKEVSPGMLLYIRATETHSFFEIEEDMVLLVVFASAPLSR
jgi:mannose-6-phosphate isomerase-like protein (cupin superfamily)